VKPALRQDILDDRIRSIRMAVSDLTVGHEVEAAAQTVRANLIDVLSLLDRSPGLDAAADDLHGSVWSAGEAAGVPSARVLRLLDEALARFEDRLTAAGVELPDRDDNLMD
jgi:hypothetical protein